MPTIYSIREKPRCYIYFEALGEEKTSFNSKRMIVPIDYFGLPNAFRVEEWIKIECGHKSHAVFIINTEQVELVQFLGVEIQLQMCAQLIYFSTSIK